MLLKSQAGLFQAAGRAGCLPSAGAGQQNQDQSQSRAPYDSRRPALVMVMQTSNFRQLSHRTICPRLPASNVGCVFVERQVSSPTMVITAITGQRTDERMRIECNNVIQTLTPNRADNTFHVSSQPRRPWRREDLLNAHRFHLIDELFAEDLVAVT